MMTSRRIHLALFILGMGLLMAVVPAPFHGSAALALDAKAIGGAPSPGPVAITPPAAGSTPAAAPAAGSGTPASANPNASNTTPKPQGVPQTGDLKTRTADGKVTSCNDVPEARGGKLLGKIVPCLIYTIEQSTITFAAKMVAFFKPLLYTFLTLVVVLFGVRMLQNEPELHKQGFLLLIKITIVLAVLNDLGNVAAYDFSGSKGKLIPAMYDVMNESQAIVAGAIDTTNLSCKISEYKGEQTQPIWAMMDCVLGKLYGFTTGKDANGNDSVNMLLVSSFFGLLSGFFFGGAWAVVVFFAMIGVLFSIFMMVIRTALGFISSYLILCIMFILTPLLLPLSFTRFTMSYFDNVWRIVLSALLTPIIITAYSMFALIVYDKILFAPTSIAQNLFDYEKIKEALQPPRQPCGRPITGKPEELRAKSDDATANKLADTLAIPFLQNKVIPALGAGNDLCAGVQVPTLNVKQIKGFAGDENAFRKIFEQLLKLFIMAFLINAGLKELPDLMIKLVGRRSAVSASQSIAGSELDFSTRARDAVNAAVERFRTSEGSNTFKSGEGFLSGLTKDAPAAARDAGNVILGNKRDKK